MSIGSIIQRARKAQGLSLAALADVAGVHRSTLSRWENGKTVPFAHELTRVMDALGLSSIQRQACYRTIEAPRVVQIVEASPHTDTLPISNGEVLRALRVRAKVTQAEAARAIGVSQGLITKWERNECYPDGEQLHKLCFALGATVDESIVLTMRSWRQMDMLPLDKNRLDAVVQDLEYHDTTRERTGFYLALAARYQTLYRSNTISEIEANDIYGYYGCHESWRLSHYSAGQKIAAPTMDSLSRSRVGLTLGQIEALIAYIEGYCKQGQADKALALLRGLEHKAENHRAWWLDYMGFAFEQAGDVDRAMQYYQESVMQAQTEQGTAVRRLRAVSMLCRNGRFRDAVRFLSPPSVSETRPNVIAATLLNHAWVFAGLGDRNDAVPYYNRAVDLMRPHNYDDINEFFAKVTPLLSDRSV